MKKILLTLAVLVASHSAAAAHADTKTETYGIHLFFNETEFVDVLTISTDANGTMTGHMFVPNDFEGAIENIHGSELSISFDLFVPKNLARPTDLVFHYKGQFFDKSRRHIIGYVTLKNEDQFLASFTGFIRN